MLNSAAAAAAAAAADTATTTLLLVLALISMFVTGISTFVFCFNVQFKKVFYYPRDTMLARVFATATCLSVCPSVCHTPVLCLAERKQDREMYTI